MCVSGLPARMASAKLGAARPTTLNIRIPVQHVPSPHTAESAARRDSRLTVLWFASPPGAAHSRALSVCLHLNFHPPQQALQEQGKLIPGDGHVIPIEPSIREPSRLDWIMSKLPEQEQFNATMTFGE